MNSFKIVIYWGYAQVGYRDSRVEKFRNNVSNGQLYDNSLLFKNISGDSLIKIKKINLPEFSGMSFISKIRMFLDPTNYVILDRQILKMSRTPYRTLLNNIAFGNEETQIRISKNNASVYPNWCKKCLDISILYYEGRYRAVDVERGFFTLIQKGRVEFAAEILAKA